MRKVLVISLALGFAIAFTNFAWANDCTTIQSGELVASNGDPITTGYDEWGYNYQAHQYNGRYCDFRRGEPGWWDANCDVDLAMKWNEGWLSNMDCIGDGKLDRHYDYDSYIGSGAWLTNHQSGVYEAEAENGKMKLFHWTYFVKIVAVPSDAVLGDESEGQDPNNWYTPDGIEIGPKIWGQFAVIQEVYNDPHEGVHGKLYKSPSSPGFGVYGPE
jgi:hypothetical protein